MSARPISATPCPCSAAETVWVSSENTGPAVTSRPGTWATCCHAAQVPGWVLLFGTAKCSSVCFTRSAGRRSLSAGLQAGAKTVSNSFSATRPGHWPLP
ncbi:hypothetical protein D3C85_206650 [compost metagenome]